MSEIGRQFAKELGRRVKKAREAKDLTQLALSQAAGLSLSQVARIEQGDADNPRMKTLLALAQALGVQVRDLIDC